MVQGRGVQRRGESATPPPRAPPGSSCDDTWQRAMVGGDGSAATTWEREARVGEEGVVARNKIKKRFPPLISGSHG